MDDKEIVKAFINFIEETIIKRIDIYLDDEEKLKAHLQEFEHFERVKDNPKEIIQRIKDHILRSYISKPEQKGYWLYVLKVLDEIIQKNGKNPKTITQRLISLIILFVRASFFEGILEHIRKIKGTKYYEEMYRIKSFFINCTNRFNDLVNRATDKIQERFERYCEDIIKKLAKWGKESTTKRILARAVITVLTVIFAIAFIIVIIIFVMYQLIKRLQDILGLLK